MPDIYDWSATANDNDDADSSINWLEGQLPGTVNGSARNMMKRVKELLTDLGGTGTVGGTANAITVTSAIATLASGKMVTFVATAANTSATVTLAVNGLTAKNIRKIDSSGGDVALIPGDIVIGQRCRVHYDSTANSAAGAWILTNPKQEARYTPGHLQGLTLSNNGSDATNDIDIAVGSARDSTDAANIDLASALTKRIDASWAVGTNQGGLDGTESVAGTPDTSTWYHVWLIKRPDTGVVDALFSESATSPTMPTNYTLKRRIGSVYNDSSGNIKAFVQDGDKFSWNTSPVADVTATNPGTSAVTRTLTVPTGIRVLAKVYAGFGATAQTDNPAGLLLSDLSVPDTAPTGAIASTQAYSSSVAINNGGGMVEVFTNTSAQIRSRIQVSAANTVLHIATFGWTDTRGRV